MNERMIELREQAGDFATETYSKYTMATFDTNKSIETLFEDKFAELILRECLEVLRLVPYDTDREFGDEVIYQDAVKKHFGVE